MTDKQLFQAAKKFLLSMDGVTEAKIKKQIKPEYRKPNNLYNIYERFCFSAQNRQMSTRVVGGSINGVQNLSKVLFEFNPLKVVKKFKKGEGLKLFSVIKKQLKPTGELRVTSRSIWPQYCETIIQAAIFLAQFEDGRDFFKWVRNFSKDNRSISALPQLISTEIDGIGFPLACDFLKEIGCLEYGKPDVHIKEIFKGIGFIDIHEKNTTKQDYEAFKVLDRIGRSNTVTTFEVDKILWLIGSGNFYRSDLNIGRQRESFIKYCQNKF